jgi:outer membrane protein, heavy metal efflux system
MNRSLSFLLATLVCIAIPSFSQSTPGQEAKIAPLDLSSLIQQATNNNPEILAAGHAVEAKREHVPQAGAWADPTVTISYGGNAFPPFTVMRADPSSNRQIMAEQMIPYPGKTHLRTEIAACDADAESLAYEAVVRQVRSEVEQTYFDLVYVDRALALLHRNRGALENFAKVTEIHYSVGKAAQQDLLRAQLEITRLDGREALLTQQQQTLEAKLNSLRNVPLDTSMGSPPSMQPSPFSYTLGQLQDAAKSNYPILKQRHAMVEENRIAVTLAHREERPDFSVGYTYMQRDALPDMYGITLSTSIPVFHHRKQDKAVAEAAETLESARQMEAKELLLAQYGVQQDFLEIQATEQLLKLYTQGIAPQSSLTLESSLAGYETGAVDFLNVIGNFQAVIDSELDYQMQISNHEKALARLEEVTGLNLIAQGDLHHE